MITLAFDSTAKAASVALTEDGCLLGDTVCDNGLTHSEILLPMADELLKKAHKSIDDVGLFACNTGPGSFTGVRIGVSLVKGLSFGKNIPCVGVSTLLSLAYNLYPLDALYCPVMDARRGQVYNALFRAENGALTRLCEDRAVSLDDLSAEIAEKYAGVPVRLCGDGYGIAEVALKARGIAVLATPELLRRQNAYSTALAAEALHRSGSAVSDKELSPVYLRLPQAERDRLAKDQP